MVGLLELTQTMLALQPAAHLTTAKWEKSAPPAPTRLYQGLLGGSD
jgi:hypothetical protein